MTKKELKNFCDENEIDYTSALNTVRYWVDYYGTAWSVVRCVAGDTSSTEYTRCGYRKNTTGQYVPGAYLSNFGWKNTYYQKAELAITFNVVT